MTPAATAPGPVAVKSADRLMSLLEYLAEVGHAPFAAVVRDLGLPNSSAHQLLQTACNRGFVELDEVTRQYRLGLRLWEVAQGYRMQDDLPALAQPLMDRLVGRTRETVQLARLDGMENVYLAISESPHAMKLVSAVGMRLAAHATGLGKTLLAGLEEEELRRRLDGVVLQRLTEHTVTDVEELVAQTRLIRERGYGEDREEFTVGCRCVAMPVHDARGGTVAAISVSVPTPRFTAELERTVHVELAATVRELEASLAAARPVPS